MKSCIALHLYYQEFWPEFWSYLKEIKDEHTDLYVTVSTSETEWYQEIKNNATEVFVIENRGQDFGGFLYVLDKIRDKDYQTITKLHGKKTIYNSSHWRQELYLPIIGSPTCYKQALQRFKDEPDIFVAGSSRHMRGHGPMRVDWLDDLLDTKHIPRTAHISGSMYIFTKKYLNIFFKGKEKEIYERSDLGYEYQTNGVWDAGHHLECLICNCESYGGKLIGI